MKILSLNTWVGSRFDPLMRFVVRQSKTVDVFCFQEVFRSRTNGSPRYRHSLFADLARALPDFRGVFCPTQRGFSLEGEGPVDYPIAIGLALFIRKSFSFRSGHAFIHRERDILLKDLRGKKFSNAILRGLPEALQYAVIGRGVERFTIAHMKGLWYPGTKRDTPARILQSDRIITALRRLPGKKILCGDFNLMPDTKSIRMIEAFPLRNLITEYGIRDTRGPIAHAQHPKSPQYFADYAFVSPDVFVKKFDVPRVSVSDHLPLILTIKD